jgi:polysaccharide deacetylase family protein (PEP-CTERM system associated)
MSPEFSLNTPQRHSVNAFSVDLEDWYQGVTSTSARREQWSLYEQRVEKNTLHLLGLLDEYHIKATFFVLGCVAKEHPDLVRQIDAAGHEVGVHGYWHRMIHRLTPDQFALELDLAIDTISPLVSKPVQGHRAPYFSINKSSLWALEILEKKGFRYDSSFFPTRNILYGYPDCPRYPHRPNQGKLVEFPLSVTRLGRISIPFSGGLYFRILPYSITRRFIWQTNQKGQPVIMYMHPWELDADHRYNQVTLREWVVQYTGRGHLERKLRHLFNEFRFCPLFELLENLTTQQGSLL